MNKFEALGLKAEIVQSVTDMGFENPTPIQEQAIPVLISGTMDFVGLAQTRLTKFGNAVDRRGRVSACGTFFAEV